MGFIRRSDMRLGGADTQDLLNIKRELRFKRVGPRAYDLKGRQFDYHLRYEPVIKSFVLSRFRRHVKNPNKAFVDELDVESVRDGILAAKDYELD